jgi:hypothetical protein
LRGFTIVKTPSTVGLDVAEPQAEIVATLGRIRDRDGTRYFERGATFLCDGPDGMIGA